VRIYQKAAQTFNFEPLNEWVDLGITVSPDVPVTIEEMNQRRGEYWMAWRGRIRMWAMRLIECGEFPATYPN